MPVPELGIIGGTGLESLDDMQVLARKTLQTPFGEPSSDFVCGKLFGRDIIFLARHGSQHQIPPHRVNYRANVWGFRELGIRQLLAFGAVGGITAEMSAAHLVIPDQIIDYTYDRRQTFFEDNLSAVTHIDFSQPYCSRLRQQLIHAASDAGIVCSGRGVYGATQGPRLETAAEINRMERDGCDIVGMTGMPEAALARELELCYATLAVVSNPAAGRGSETLEMEEMVRQLEVGMKSAALVLKQLLQRLA